MGNSSYLRFDDDDKTKCTFSQSSQGKWVNWKHTVPYNVQWMAEKICLILLTLNKIYLTCWIYFKGNNNFSVLCYFANLTWHKYLKSSLMEDQGFFILQSQYHGCWWPGDRRNQGISSHDVGLVCLEYSSFSTRSVNITTVYSIVFINLKNT